MKRKVGIVFPTSAGKTIVALQALSELKTEGECGKILVVAPPKVCRDAWKNEVNSWEQISHLKVNLCLGSPEDRLEKLKDDSADVYVVTRDTFPKMVKDFSKNWKWDSLIIDEAHGFKDPSRLRFKAAKKVTPILKNLLWLTATPFNKDRSHLFTLLYMIDNGKRLGRTVTSFRNSFMTHNSYTHSWSMKPECNQIIDDLIEDVVFSLNDDEKPQLPDSYEETLCADMSPQAKGVYKTLGDDFICKVNDTDISVPNKAVLYGKLTQICNGAIYDENKEYHELCDNKIKALKELLDENKGENFLVVYKHRSDVERILKAIPEATTMSNNLKEKSDWDAGKIRALVIHPESCGEGLNLQKGGNNIVWFGSTSNLRHFTQTNGRLIRRGQNKPVRIIHLITDTVIERNNIDNLKNKEQSLSQFLTKMATNLKEEFNSKDT